MTLPVEIARLIEIFERNKESYLKGQYNEAQVRKEFIDPFFRALGWDIDNTAGNAEAYKDVIHEDSIRIGSSIKAPDYCFRIGGTRKFFLEAKKPAVNIKGDPSPAYQLRRYAWSAKLPLSILTDFEEFAVYDCRVRPNKNDKPSTARTLYFTYDEYAERWDEIASIFARDAILKGSFDKYAQSTKRKRGTAEVDAAFLAEIETWRDNLARNIALRNTTLSNRELNFAVQRTIDRIIFLRICEDRGIEPYAQLQGLVNGRDVYPRLVALFRRADDRYNSGLFHFMREKDRTEGPDELTPDLAIDDKLLKDILRSLYYPDSPYEFSVLPPEILGHVYEQFLGKVITLTSGHRAKVEDKPEVKKAGGVYYTPSYIVDYIVEHTVGKLLEGASVKFFKTRPPRLDRSLRILDPACGSGSFLLGAYQILLDWYRKYYEENEPDKWAAAKFSTIYQAGAQGWKLTTAERKRILLDHIYGVDIDTQAVEVTKLSLLLQVLEGEKNLRLFHNERALPDLSDNIKCGNSLIGPDFYEDRPFATFDAEERLRINAFEWHAEFPHIFKDGGFDAVIGNPPYIRIQTLKDTRPASIPYFSEHYRAATKGNYDIYVVFVEQALNLLCDKGRMGYILPHKFFNAQYGQPLRKVIADGKHLSHVVHFGDQQIFEGATTYTCLLLLDETAVESCAVAKVSNLVDWKNAQTCCTGSISHAEVTSSEWNFVVGPGAALFRKLQASNTKLGDVVDVFVGLQTSADDVFIMDLVADFGDVLCLRSKALASEVTLEKALVFPIISGTDVNRYASLSERQYVLFPYEVDESGVRLIDYSAIKSTYPLTGAYLADNRKRLEDREKGRMRGPQWYGYIYLKNMARQRLLKLCVPRLVEHLYASIDTTANHFLDNVDVGGLTVKDHYADLDIRYLLGLLNSKLLRWLFPFVSAPFRGGWLSANKQFLCQLPIRIIDVDSSAERSRHEKVLELVDGMLQLHAALGSAKTPDEKNALQRQIDATDKQIDQLVYELYGLTDAEIRIVEEVTK